MESPKSKIGNHTTPIFDATNPKKVILYPLLHNYGRRPLGIDIWDQSCRFQDEQHKCQVL